MMAKVVLIVLLFILLVIFWPLVYWLSAFFWFGQVDSIASHDVVVFIPMGIITALAVTMPQLSRKYSGCLMAGCFGYLIATPIAWFATLYGSLILGPWLSATLLGSLPLLVFTFVGYKIGEKMYRHNQGLPQYY